jgi:hypothetical protein
MNGAGLELCSTFRLQLRSELQFRFSKEMDSLILLSINCQAK